MVAVFGGFVLGDDTTIRQFGFALAVGILLDAFLIRMTLMPAVLHLAGERAWWLPRSLDRVLPRVDIELRADWQELGSRELGAPLLKAAFPLPVENPEASFEIPWGAITRPANGEEVPGQKWIDVSETERTLVGTDQDSEPLDLSAHYNEDVIATPAAPADGDFDAGRSADAAPAGRAFVLHQVVRTVF